MKSTDLKKWLEMIHSIHKSETVQNQKKLSSESSHCIPFFSNFRKNASSLRHLNSTPLTSESITSRAPPQIDAKIWARALQIATSEHSAIYIQKCWRGFRARIAFKRLVEEQFIQAQQKVLLLSSIRARLESNSAVSPTRLGPFASGQFSREARLAVLEPSPAKRRRVESLPDSPRASRCGRTHRELSQVVAPIQSEISLLTSELLSDNLFSYQPTVETSAVQSNSCPVLGGNQGIEQMASRNFERDCFYFDERSAMNNYPAESTLSSASKNTQNFASSELAVVTVPLAYLTSLTTQYVRL